MSNLEKYNKIFTDIFNVDLNALNSSFVYQTIPVWDSVAHMALVSTLEDSFGIMFDTDDILNFNSYENGKAILFKYGIEI